MTSQLINSESFSGVFEKPASWFDALTSAIEAALSSSQGLHFIAFVSAALIVVTCICLGLFFIIKIFSLFFKSKPSAKNTKTPAIEVDTEETSETAALESELQSELTKTESLFSESDEKQPLNDKENALFQEINPPAIEDYRDSPQRIKENPLVDLDWKNTRKNHQVSATLSSMNQPLTLRKSLQDLICMIVNMIGRNIDELKIAQALMYRCKDDLSEESVLQVVHSIKEFLNLCHQHAFDNVRKVKDLPSDEDCVLRLIAGDSSYAMALLEALMDDRITQAISMKNNFQRAALFGQASNYACYFGTLAEINDVNLASASFELAVEMNPENVTAWSRCADLYKKIGLDDKAHWAYRKVLKLTKQADQRQEANARKYLSQYFYANGDTVQASEYYQKSKTFYDTIGINRPLDRKELEILEILDQTEKEKIMHSVLGYKQRQNAF